MRLVSYRDGGANRLGARTGSGSLVALPADDPALPSDILEFLEGGAETMAAVGDWLASDDSVEMAVDEATIRLRPIVPRPPKIICVARNYGEHAAEAGLDVLDVPNLFIRFAQGLIADGDPILVPKVSHKLDWEAELAVIIGRRGKHVPADAAYDHVAGYALFNDVTVRDWQLRAPPIQFGAGKNFDASGPFGPELVTRDEVPDPHALQIGLAVNGETMQSGSTADMIFSIPALIEHISQFTTLEPGDVIATGTPSGVGHFRSPPVYLRRGDTVRVEIEGIGRLENPVDVER